MTQYLQNKFLIRFIFTKCFYVFNSVTLAIDYGEGDNCPNKARDH